MSLFDKLNATRKNEWESDIPTKGWKMFFYVMINNAFKLVWVNILFLLFSIPILTIPAAYCGMNKVIVSLYCENRADVFRDFYEEFKQSFVESVIIGLFHFISIVFMFFIVKTQTIQNLQGWLLNVLGVFVLITITVIVNYSFIMQCYLKLSLKNIFKNSILLTLKSPARSLSLFCLPSLLNLLTYFFLPYTFPAFILILFSLNQLVICNITIEPIKKAVVLQEEV